MAPKPPTLVAPGKAVALLVYARSTDRLDWGPRDGPKPPTLVAPWQSRGAPRLRPLHRSIGLGAPRWPQTPHPRRAPAKPLRPPLTPAPSQRRCAPRLRPLHLNCADLVLGNLGRRVEGGVREKVRRRLAELYERHEDRARLHRFGDARVAGELAAAALDSQPRAVVHAEAARVARVDRDLEPRRQLHQPLHATGERAAVPVVEQAAGVEHERIVGVGQLGRRLDLSRRDESAPAARERLGIQKARAGVLGSRTRPLQSAVAIQPRV